MLHILQRMLNLDVVRPSRGKQQIWMMWLWLPIAWGANCKLSVLEKEMIIMQCLGNIEVKKWAFESLQLHQWPKLWFIGHTLTQLPFIKRTQPLIFLMVPYPLLSTEISIDIIAWLKQHLKLYISTPAMRSEGTQHEAYYTLHSSFWSRV